MTRNYSRHTVPGQWADERNTDMPVAVAIFAIADSKRSAQAIWEAPTAAEWDHVTMAVQEYVNHGDYDFNPNGYSWGQEVIKIEAPEA